MRCPLERQHYIECAESAQHVQTQFRFQDNSRRASLRGQICRVVRTRPLPRQFWRILGQIWGKMWLTSGSGAMLDDVWTNLDRNIGPAWPQCDIWARFFESGGASHSSLAQAGRSRTNSGRHRAKCVTEVGTSLAHSGPCLAASGHISWSMSGPWSKSDKVWPSPGQLGSPDTRCSNVAVSRPNLADLGPKVGRLPANVGRV